MGNSDISKRLKQIRNELSMTQVKFSEVLGIRQNYLSRYESGESDLPDSVKIKLCDISEKQINMHWLLTGKGEMFLSEKQSGTVIIGSGIISNVGHNNNIVTNTGNEIPAVNQGYEELFHLICDYATPKMVKELKQKLLKIKEASDE